MAELRLDNLRKSFAGHDVIRDVSLTVPDGAFCVFVGPSGCGKSTLLRLIAGLEEATAGRILIDGRDVTALEPYERDLSMVFQSYALYPHMSVRDNIAFALRTARRPESEVAERVAEAARILQLEPYLDRKPAQLSGGQRQRVAIGRAIVKHPKLFLFDEPLSNLDAKLRTQMRVELMALHRELKATMVYVTHDQVEAMTMADRIVVVNAGRIEQVGAPMELYHRPATLFVAGFIGAPPMNLLPVTVTGGMAASGGVALGPAPAGATTFGIRPEHVQVSGAGGSGPAAEVVLRETLGGDAYLHLRLSGGQPLVARVEGDTRFGLGDAVALAFPPERAHAFDAEGRSLTAV